MSHYDVVVIGTGAGGASAAYKLAKEGCKVLALEKGPWRETDDFAEGGVFDGQFSSRGRGDEIKYIQSPSSRSPWGSYLIKNQVAPNHFSANRFIMPRLQDKRRLYNYSEHSAPHTKYQDTDSGWMSQLVGGGTVHYGGASFRQLDVDFKMKDKFGSLNVPGLGSEHQADLHNWPLDLSDFAPWYDEAERVIGIAAAPGSGLTPLRFNKAANRIHQALQGQGNTVNGKRVDVEPTPMAINSQNHLGRSPCHHSGLCQDYACRFGSKSDMRVTTLAEGIKTGNLDIQANTFVRRLNIVGDTVESVDCIVGNAEGNYDHVCIETPVVVVACETIESIRLLLASGFDKPGLLGHYVMFHVTGGARSISPDPTTTWDTAPHTAYIPSFYDDSQPGQFVKTGVLLISSVDGPMQEADGLWGTEALHYFNDVYPYKMDLSYVGEGLPTKFNRVELATDVDKYGMPISRITYRPHVYDINAGEYIADRAKEVLAAAGGTTIDNAPDHLKGFLRKSTTASRVFHASGGCRFGDDPATSVLDRNCKIHELCNAYVADGSFMPTGSGFNPTLTFQANALRVGKHIADTW